MDFTWLSALKVSPKSEFLGVVTLFHTETYEKISVQFVFVNKTIIVLFGIITTFNSIYAYSTNLHNDETRNTKNLYAITLKISFGDMFVFCYLNLFKKFFVRLSQCMKQNIRKVQGFHIELLVKIVSYSNQKISKHKQFQPTTNICRSTMSSCYNKEKSNISF